MIFCFFIAFVILLECSNFVGGSLGLFRIFFVGVGVNVRMPKLEELIVIYLYCLAIMDNQ
jgi:hypothetical protein